MRLSSWSSPFSISRAMASATAGIGGLFQHGKLGLGIAHAVSLEQIAKPSKQCFLTDA